MKTFKEYGLPPSAAKGAKAHIKPLPKKKVGEAKAEIDHTGEHDPYAKKHNVKIKPIKDDNGYAHHAVGTRANLKEYLTKHYKHAGLDASDAADHHPDIFGKKTTNEAKIDQNVYYKVTIEGLPPLYLPAAEGLGKVRSGLRKILKRPDMVSDMERQTGAQVRKAFRMMGQGKEDEELKHVREAIGPDSEDDAGEYDYEGEMTKNDLMTMISAAYEIYKMLGDNDNLPEWVQAKITKATDYVDTVRDYLKSESVSD